MNLKIEPLPANLAELRGEPCKEAIESRRTLLETVFEQAGDDYDMTKVTALNGDSHSKTKQIKSLTGELAKLNDFAEVTEPHPGHPPQPGGNGRRYERKAGEYGRVEGLGAAFVKAVGGMKALDATSGGGTLPDGFFDARLQELPQRQLFVRSLIPTTQLSSGDKINFVRQTTFVNSASPVAAGELKPTSSIAVERVEEPIVTIAHVSEALDRMLLSDYDQLTQFIDNQLRLGVLLAEETQILYATGSAGEGILTSGLIQTQALGGDSIPDAVHKAITKIRLNAFQEPDAVVFHPNDWQEVALLRTTDGIYIWGSPLDATEPRIWGKRVITSPVIAEGSALVGAFGASAEVYQREGARVTFAETGLGDSAGEELFTRNQVRFRAESRLALAVIRPYGFCEVTGV